MGENRKKMVICFVIILCCNLFDIQYVNYKCILIFHLSDIVYFLYIMDKSSPSLRCVL